MDTMQFSYRLPPSDWKQASEHIFLGFILHYHTSECSCGAKSEWTETWRAFGHRTLTYGSAYRRLVPLHDAELPQNEPIATFSLPAVHTAVCHHCINRHNANGTEVVALRMASDERNWLMALWEDQRREQIQRRKEQEPKRAASSGEAAKPAATLSDIMSI